MPRVKIYLADKTCSTDVDVQAIGNNSFKEFDRSDSYQDIDSPNQLWLLVIMYE